ncbi:MAG: PqqD family protein [Candidatus Flexifilum sp.]|jgi:hypothetical protein
MIAFSRRVVVPEDVLVRQIAGEAVLLNLNTETYFGLDEVGTDMWQALTTSATIEQAFTHLLSVYDVEAEVLRADLTALIEELIECGLVALVDP